MPTLSWNTLAQNVAIAARPSGVWTKAYEYVGGKKLLKIEAAADQTWTYAANATCGPDGDLASPLSILTPISDKAAVGTLIAKIGGSSASKDDGVLSFPVGSFCVIRLGDGQEGPLYLTINDSTKGFGDNSGEVRVNVYEAT